MICGRQNSNYVIMSIRFNGIWLYKGVAFGECKITDHDLWCRTVLRNGYTKMNLAHLEHTQPELSSVYELKSKLITVPRTNIDNIQTLFKKFIWIARVHTNLGNGHQISSRTFNLVENFTLLYSYNLWLVLDFVPNLHASKAVLKKRVSARTNIVCIFSSLQLLYFSSLKEPDICSSHVSRILSLHRLRHLSAASRATYLWF